MFCSPASSRSATNGVVFHDVGEQRAGPTPRAGRRTSSARRRLPAPASAVDEAARALEHEAPDERGHDRRDRPGQQHGGAHERRAHASRGSSASASTSPAASSSATLTATKPAVCASALQKRGVAQRLHVVVEADERTAQPRHAQIVQVQRLPERPRDRDERHERDDCRAPAAPAPTPTSRLARSPCRRACHSRRISGAHAGPAAPARAARASPRAASRSAAPRLLLPRQRAVQRTPAGCRRARCRRA